MIAMMASLVLQCVVQADGGFEKTAGSSSTRVSLVIEEAAFSASGHRDLANLTVTNVMRVGQDVMILQAVSTGALPARVEIFVAPLISGSRRMNWSVVDASGQGGHLAMKDMVTGTCTQITGGVEQTKQ